MKLTRKFLLAIAILALALISWLWWNRYERVDMAAYVPADSLIFIEAQSLPNILNALTSTKSWRELAPVAGVKSDYGKYDWLTRLSAQTGIGPSDLVVLSRAQVAVTIMGFDAAEESSETLKITPRVALVCETHSSAWRVRAALEKLVGNFARQTYKTPSVERKEMDGTPYIIWHSPTDARRKIVSAIAGSVAVIGNDEQAVQACLAVRRGERPSLAGHDQLETMRARLNAKDALAFGYAPTGSAAKMVEIFAPAFVGQLTENPNIQSVLAVQLPILTNKLIGNAGWSARLVAGDIEDDYFLAPTDKVTSVLKDSLAAASVTESESSEVLPPDVDELSRYTFRDPALAWQGFYASLSTQVDIAQAQIITRALEALLKPYGIEEPRVFLSAVGQEISTVRLESNSETKLLVVSVRDAEVLRGQVRARLGSNARRLRVGDDEIIVSDDPERGAARFVGGFLILGDEEDVRHCLAARAAGRSLKDEERFKSAQTTFSSEPAFVTTLTKDHGAAISTVRYISRLNGSGDASVSDAELEKAQERRPYSVSETHYTGEGFMKITRSSFGQLGEIIARFTRDE